MPKHYLVIDTETAGDLSYPVAYDVGWVICDRQGNIFEKKHFLVKEVFADLRAMATAYYANKFPGYLDRLYSQDITPVPFAEVLRAFDRDVKEYKVDTLSAYNLLFDRRAMANTCEWLYGCRDWNRFDLEELCIMCAACDVLYGKKYIKLCREQGWTTEKNNVKCSAETGYRYISGDYDFEEEHRGADDCQVEAQILAAIFKTHKKFDGTPKGFPMRKVYAREKEEEEAAE